MKTYFSKIRNIFNPPTLNAGNAVLLKEEGKETALGGVQPNHGRVGRNKKRGLLSALYTQQAPFLFCVTVWLDVDACIICAMKVTKIYLSDHQDRALRELAKKTDMKFSEHVRRAVDLYLEQEKRRCESVTSPSTRN